MIDAVILIMILWFAFVGIITFLFFDKGSKGIEKDPYYGQKTGKIYTAKKSREKHIV